MSGNMKKIVAAAAASLHDHDHDEDEDHGEGMDTIMKLKIALIVILFCIVYLGLIPAYSKYCRSSKLALSLMNCFAGGVFLAMAFIHILPESVESYNAEMEKRAEAAEAAEALASNKTATAAAGADKHEHHADFFPLPYLLFFIGYCLVLLIDRVFAGEHGHSHGHGGHDHQHNQEDLEAKKLKDIGAGSSRSPVADNNSPPVLG